MSSKEYPDPVADWFTRHRAKLALLLFVAIMLGRVPRLLEGTTGGTISFVYAAAFFGLLTWSMASRQDRNDAGHWHRFALLWTVFLTVQIGMVVVSLALGHAFRGQWLLAIVIVGVLAGVHWLAFRRIRSGKQFPIEFK